MANVVPGYDFSVTEEVTASKLLKWLVGGTLSGTVSQGGTNAGTGFSLSGMTNEGDLEVNFSTGKVYVKTRWGQVPVMGGGMFTKRCAMYFEVGSSYNQNAFYTAEYKIGPHGNQLTHVSLAGLPAAMGPGIGPENAYCYCTHFLNVGGNNWISYGGSLWPSAELQDGNYDRTAPTCATTIHPTVCLMGFTPIYASICTSYTGSRKEGGGTEAIRFRTHTSQAEQFPFGSAGVWAMGGPFTVASSGTTNLHWGYVMPCIGTPSSLGAQRSLNLRL